MTVDGNNFGNFRLFRSENEIKGNCEFSNICFSNTNHVEMLTDDWISEFTFPSGKSPFVETCTTNIPPRPGEVIETIAPTEDEELLLYYLDENNCNKQKRCNRTLSESDNNKQVEVVVLVSKFEDYSQENEDGGAINIVNCGLKCKNNEFINCVSSNGAGGAVYFYNKMKQFENKLDFYKLKFTKCKAQYGGAVYIHTDSDNDNISIIDCTFDQNEALSTDSKDPSKYGGSSIFLTTKVASILLCYFSNGKGPGGSIKIYSIFDESSSKAMLNNRFGLNSILVNGCTFEVEKQSIFYVSGSDGSQVNVKSCKFSGNVADGKTHYIDGVLFDKEAPKISVNDCIFDCELKFAVNLNLMKELDSETQQNNNSSNKDKKMRIKYLSIVISCAILAIVVVTILMVMVKKHKKESNVNDESLEMEEPLNEKNESA